MNSINPAELLKQLTDQTVIVDVREPDEFAGGHVHNAINVPLSELSTQHQEIPDGAYIICQTGMRSAMATEFLQSNDQQVTNVLGGVEAWPQPLEG